MIAPVYKEKFVFVCREGQEFQLYPLRQTSFFVE